MPNCGPRNLRRYSRRPRHCPQALPLPGTHRRDVPAVARPGRVKASPVAKRLAAELGIDLATVLPTGPDGLISGDDVRAAHHAKDRAIPAANEIKLSAIKKLVAERMKGSYLDAPHIHLTLACDMSEAVRLREQANRGAAADCHVTFTDIVAWAVAGTLVKHPLLNATLRDDCIVFSPAINVGIAADTERGLVVPVVKHADRLSLLELSRARSALVDRVRGGKQTTDDLEGGTFTVTNLGMYGIQAFDPIITPGQAGILGVGEVALTPVADEAGVRAVPLMRLTLACDHRIADGADGAKFLAAVKARLEHPSL